MCTNPSYCYDLACNSSLMRYKVQSSNKLNAIRGASRWFEGEYTLLSLFHFEVWKRKKTSLFIIIKRQHRTQRSIIKAWIVRYNKSFGLTKRWHLKRVCLLMSVLFFCAVASELTEATQTRSTDQQVISKKPRKVPRHWNVQIIPPVSNT